MEEKKEEEGQGQSSWPSGQEAQPLNARRPGGSWTLLGLAILALWVLGCGDDSDPSTDSGVDAEGSDAGVDAAPSDSGVDGWAACTTPEDVGPAPLPDAGAPAPPPALDCGEPTFPEGTSLRRWPYLQSVTPTAARVVWTTTGGGAGTLRYRGPGDVDWREITASAELFERSRTDDTEDYVAYEVRLTGLSPSAAYCYEIEEDGVVLASGLGFRTAWTGAGAEDGQRAVRVLAFGDSGNGSAEQRRLADRFMDNDYDLFLHLGDMAYDSGTFPEFEQNVFGVYRRMLHRVPTWPTIGNHEDKTERARPYLDVYSLPEMALRESDQERYYSFDYGDVHFVSIDSNDGTLIPIALDRSGADDDMLDWLAQDLAASDAPWKIAFFHHPPYSSSSRSPNLGVRSTVVPILEEGGVDLVLAGHNHHYERTFPILQGCLAQRDDSAITYIIAGAGGAGPSGDISPQWWHVASNDRLHSYVELDIHGCVAEVRAIAIDGTLIDSFELDGCD